MAEIDDVLEFWFHDDTRARWFDPIPEFDQTVRKRFAELFARAATGQLGHWEETAEGCLALCILLDQMPRNMFRGTARAFATDERALRVAERAIERGLDRDLPAEQQQFLYMPFMHSERLANQLRALALFESAHLIEGRRFAEEHVEVIRRFGRFPHRNPILGRESTPEEEAYLRDQASAWAQLAPAPEPPPEA